MSNSVSTFRFIAQGPSKMDKVDQLCALIEANEQNIERNRLETERLINSGFRKCWYPGCLRQRMPVTNNTAICETVQHNPYLPANKELYAKFLASSCKCQWCGRIFFTDFPLESDPPSAKCDFCGLFNSKQEDHENILT